MDASGSLGVWVGEAEVKWNTQHSRTPFFSCTLRHVIELDGLESLETARMSRIASVKVACCTQSSHLLTVPMNSFAIERFSAVGASIELCFFEKYCHWHGTPPGALRWNEAVLNTNIYVMDSQLWLAISI